MGRGRKGGGGEQKPLGAAASVVCFGTRRTPRTKKKV
jgi:hypothetical protein